jgi:hypothetical protein
MAWTNLIAAFAIGALASCLFLRARSLAADEEAIFRLPPRLVRWRVRNYRLGGLLLVLVAIAMFIAGIH